LSKDRDGVVVPIILLDKISHMIFF
jgi:hypothetical protein